MAKIVHCWRCKIEVPMLDEREWEEIAPLMAAGYLEIKEYRRINGVSLPEAKEHVYGQGVLKRYFEMTGFRETNIDAIWHHRLRQLGPPCPSCGKPLRTPRAKLCAECGANVESRDPVAGEASSSTSSDPPSPGVSAALSKQRAS